MLSELSTFALLGQRYVDTQHDASYIASLEAELAHRKVVGAQRALLEYLAASALWWNIIWWDWESLDGRDIRWGWISNTIVFGLAGFLAGQFFGVGVAFVAVATLHLGTLYIALKLRKGSLYRAGPSAESA